MGLNYGWYEKGVLTMDEIYEMYLEHRTVGHGDHVVPKFYYSLVKKLEGTSSEAFEPRAAEYISLISSDYSDFMNSYGFCRIAEQKNITESKYKSLKKLLTEAGCQKALGFLKQNA